MAGILELLRGTTDPTTPGTGLGDIYFKGASDAAMLLYYRRPDGTVVELAPSSGGLVLPSAGGTGIANNNASTLAITGAFATTFTVTATTGVTLPTSGTLATLAGSETFSNKTLSGYVLTGNVTSTGNPSLNIGSGALTAGATGVTTLTASGSVTMTSGGTSAAQQTIAYAATGGDAALLINNTDTDASSRASLQLKTGTSVNVWQLFARNNSVTLGVSGVADYITFNASGMNGTLGATTPAAASVTTLSANSGSSTAGITTQDAGPSQGTVQFGTSSTAYNIRGGADYIGVEINAVGGKSIFQKIGGTAITTVTGTGLAVTGALSATGGITNTQASGNSTLVLSGSGAYSSVVTLNGAGGGSGQVTAGASVNLVLNAPTGQSVFGSINNATITTTSSTGLAVTGDVSSTQQLLWGSASQGRVSHDGTNAYFDNTVSGATYFRTNGTTLMGTWQASGLAVTGALSATGTIYGSGGSLAVAGNGTFIASNLSTGRLLSGGATTVNAINTYFDNTAYEISAGSTGVYVSGITVAARGYAGTGGEGVAVWQRGAEVARFSPTGLAVTGALSATTTITTGGYTVATLPAGTVGMRAYVTDATAPTYNGALTGGGAVTVPVFYNGAAWVSA